ncbi:hypothetical protein V8B97DRAFT_1917904 [Scleroderma yunnanense]
MWHWQWSCTISPDRSKDTAQTPPVESAIAEVAISCRDAMLVWKTRHRHLRNRAQMQAVGGVAHGEDDNPRGAKLEGHEPDAAVESWFGLKAENALTARHDGCHPAYSDKERDE